MVDLEDRFLVKNVRAALFDLDGVVVFTDRYHYLAWKKLADEHGWQFDENINHNLRGVPRLDSLNVILNCNSVDLSDSDKLSLANQKNDYYVEMLDSIGENDIYPGVVDFIKKLRDLGLKTGLCSSSKNAQKVLDILDIADLFDVVVTGADIEKAKPDPQIFLKASCQLEIHHLNCVVFEDAKSGVEAALAANMFVVGVGERDNLINAHSVLKDYSNINIQALIETGYADYPFEISEWQICHKDFDPKRIQLMESCFTLSNGYMGVRGTLEEDYIQNRPGFCVSGFYEKVPRSKYWFDEPDYFQTTVNHYDWCSVRLFVGGEEFSLLSGNVLHHQRKLNIRTGVLERSCEWESPSGKRVDVTTERVISLNEKHSAALRYTVKPLNFSGSIRLVSAVIFYQQTSLTKDSVIEVASRDIEGSTFISCYHTKLSGIQAAFSCRHMTDCEVHEKSTLDDKQYIYECEFICKEGEKFNLDKHICLYTSLDTCAEKLISVAKERIEIDSNAGFGLLKYNNIKSWEEFWKDHDIIIGSDSTDQGGVRFNIFQLRQAHNNENIFSIPANGLTGDHFMGLIFWDTDVYIHPYYSYNAPEMAKKICEYRYNTIDQARAKAKLMGGKGAKYPWTTIDGHESSCNPTVGPCQYHINGDVVFAVWRYFTTSGDFDFMCEKGAEIVLESARFWADLGHYVEDGRFFIDFVTGPDEFNYLVNNDFYTNMLAKFNWRFAVDIAHEIKAKSPDKYKAIADKIGLSDNELVEWARLRDSIFLPYNREKGVYEQDDAFLNRKLVDISKLPGNYGAVKRDYTLWDLGRRKIIKQPSVVLIEQMLHREFSLEQKKRDYDYYIQFTTHGSSLSPAIHSITASEIGYKNDSYKLFRNSLYLDLCDFRRNTCNGLHYACIGSTWMAIVNGFAGMRDDGNRLSFTPHLPDLWKSLEFKIKYKKCLLNVSISKSRADFRLEEGESFSFNFSEKEYILADSDGKKNINIDY